MRYPRVDPVRSTSGRPLPALVRAVSRFTDPVT
jgi:hypothetical protein